MAKQEKSCGDLWIGRIMSFDQEERFPRRELQGPRPTPLKISRDSHRIKKPPLPAPGIQYRPPVIIYTQSPKIIHTNAGEFMTLVQRLTGRSPANNPAGSDISRPQPSHILNAYHEPSANPKYAPLEEPTNFGVSNPNYGLSGEAPPECNPVPSLPSPTMQSGLFSPLSPSFFMPLSPNLFQDLPIFTPQSEYFMSPRHFLYRHPDALFTPPLRSSINAFSSLSSPSPAGCDLFNNRPDY